MLRKKLDGYYVQGKSVIAVFEDDSEVEINWHKYASFLGFPNVQISENSILLHPESVERYLTQENLNRAIA